ncbi:MAG: hypothetical protein JNM29_13015 [Candidatus Odyssella sp.]|nr:hypothetical protein [Candidatus Odyssella sp.]
MIPPRATGRISTVAGMAAILLASAGAPAGAAHLEGPDGGQWIIFAAGFGGAALLALVLCWRLPAAFLIAMPLILVPIGLAAWMVLDDEIMFDREHAAAWLPLSYATLAAPFVVLAAGVAGWLAGRRRLRR